MDKVKGKPSILIVDDEKSTRDGLERALQNTYNISLAENAERALKVLDDSPI
jgi:PleD family two-component response regulator